MAPPPEGARALGPRGSPGRPARRRAPGRRRRAPGGPSGARPARLRRQRAAVAERKAEAEQARVEVGDLGPEQDHHEPQGGGRQHQTVRAVPLGRRAGRPAGAEARSAVTSRAASSSIALAKWVMTTDGGRTSLTVTAPSSTCTTRRTAAASGRVAKGRLLPVPAPGHRGDRQDQQAHQRGGPAVTDLDQGGEVERGEPLTVAPGPVVAASHAGAGDPDDAAKHDRGRAQNRCRPRPDAGAVRSGPDQLMWSKRRLLESARERTGRGRPLSRLHLAMPSPPMTPGVSGFPGTSDSGAPSRFWWAPRSAAASSGSPPAWPSGCRSRDPSCSPGSSAA